MRGLGPLIFKFTQFFIYIYIKTFVYISFRVLIQSSVLAIQQNKKILPATFRIKEEFRITESTTLSLDVSILCTTNLT